MKRFLKLLLLVFLGAFVVAPLLGNLVTLVGIPLGPPTQFPYRGALWMMLVVVGVVYVGWDR